MIRWLKYKTLIFALHRDIWKKKIERMEEKLKGWKRLHCPNFTNQNRVGVNIVIFDVIIFNAKKNHTVLTETVCTQLSRNTSQL